jgi:hypothetical protein
MACFRVLTVSFALWPLKMPVTVNTEPELMREPVKVSTH